MVMNDKIQCDLLLLFNCFISVFSATLFLELWKRHRARHVSQWNVYDWCEDEVLYRFCLTDTVSLFKDKFVSEKRYCFVICSVT